MRAKARGGSRRGIMPYGGRYARRARGNGLYGRGDIGGIRGGIGDIGTKKNTLPRDIGILLFLINFV